MKIHAMVSNGIIAVAIASALFFGMKAASKKRVKAPDPAITAVEEPITLEPMPATEVPLVKPKSEVAFKTSQEDIERLRARKEEMKRAAEEESIRQEITARRPSWFPPLRPPPPPTVEPEMTEEERKELGEFYKRVFEHLDRNGGKYNPDDAIVFPKTWPEGKLIVLPGGRTITVSNGLTIEGPSALPTVRTYDPSKFRGGLPHSLVKRLPSDNSPSTPSSP